MISGDHIALLRGSRDYHYLAEAVPGLLEEIERLRDVLYSTDQNVDAGNVTLRQALAMTEADGTTISRLTTERDEARRIASRWMTQAGQSDWVAGHGRDEWERDVRAMDAWR